MKKKILLTGATGFLGSNLLHKFLSEDFDVVIIARKTSNFSRIQESLARIQILYLENLDYELVFRVFRLCCA